MAVKRVDLIRESNNIKNNIMPYGEFIEFFDILTIFIY